MFLVCQVAGRLQDFRELVKEVVRSACRTALLEAGFTPDDYFYDGADSPGIYGELGLVSPNHNRASCPMTTYTMALTAIAYTVSWAWLVQTLTQTLGLHA